MPILLICLKIFFCRIIDVSLGTVRTIFSVKGKPAVAALIGFLEAGLWFLVVREALTLGDSSLFIALSYALGFASGTYIGGIVARSFIHGIVEVQAVLSKGTADALNKIRAAGYAITVVDVSGSHDDDEKYMLFAEISNKRLKDFKNLINSLDDKAFIMVRETKNVYNGYFGN